MLSSSNHQEHKKDEENNEKTQQKERGNLSSSSSKGPKSNKKELQCKFCNKRFSNSQAMGGHQNAHKEERAAAKRENILTMASAYRETNSHSYVQNYYSPFENNNNRTLGVQPSLPILLENVHRPHQQVPLGPSYSHNVMPGRQIMNVNPQPTMHQLQALMVADRFRDLKTNLSSFGIRTSNLGLQPNLRENQNPLQASSSLPRLESNYLYDSQNFDQANHSLRVPRNDNIEDELDLTLKL